MNIEFTLEDYFNELQLMDMQYAQEEALYPWVYMLLQMAECKKKSILGKSYNSVSIRDVHLAKSATVKNKIKLFLLSKKGTPDMAVLNINTSAFLGCIEVKSSPTLAIKEGNFPKEKSLELKKYSITYTANTTDLSSPKIDIDQKIISLIEENLEELINNKFIYSTNDFVVNPSYKRQNNFYYEIEIAASSILDFDKLSSELTNSFSGTLIDSNSKTIAIPFSRSIASTPSSWEWKSIYGWGKKEDQIISHLEKFKKVLYTNGLEFYFLTLSKDEKMINVEKIADLTKCYSNSCKTHTCFASMTPAERLSAYAEWDKLIAGLTAIDWHHAPITKID